MTDREKSWVWIKAWYAEGRECPYTFCVDLYTDIVKNMTFHMYPIEDEL